MQSHVAKILFPAGILYNGQKLPVPWGVLEVGDESLDVLVYVQDQQTFSEGEEVEIELVGFCQYQEESDVTPFLLATVKGQDVGEVVLKTCEVRAARFLHRVFDVCSFGNALAANALVELRYNK